MGDCRNRRHRTAFRRRSCSLARRQARRHLFARHGAGQGVSVGIRCGARVLGAGGDGGRSGHRRDLHRNPQHSACRAGVARDRARQAVLIEKPLATSVADAERIASEAAGRKCFAMEAMWTRFLPAVRAAKELVDDGAIGKVARIDAELSYSAMKLVTAASSTRGSAAARRSTSASIPSRWRFTFWANR